MVKSFKVQKNNKLTITDELVYSTLCCYSDNNGISNISRQRIAEKTGIRKLDTIAEHTNKLVELKLIEKTYTFEGGKRLAHYKILNPKINFMWVSNDLFDLKKPGLIGFVVKMAGLR